MYERIDTIDWKDVFNFWKDHEGDNQGWLNVATKQKGWPDWESWRMFSANQMRLPDRDWELFEMTDPMSDIPNMIIGPFQGWQSRLPVMNKYTFAEMARMPEQESFFRAHDKVASMMENFPKNTCFTGFKKEGTDQVVCIEGHHRAMAVAIAQLSGKPLDFGDSVRIALTTLKKGEEVLLDQVLARGTQRVSNV